MKLIVGSFGGFISGAHLRNAFAVLCYRMLIFGQFAVLVRAKNASLLKRAP